MTPVVPATDPNVAIAAAVAAAMAQSAASQQFMIALVGAIATLLGLVIQGVIAIALKRMGDGVKETKSATEKIADSTEKIHVAVNSERAKTTEQISLLRDQVLALSKVIAKHEQLKEDTAAAAAAAAAKSEP